MDDNYPIAIVSFGAERNISFRRIGAKGNPERQLLEDGSLLLMHAGMQTAWQHKIPKHDGPCGRRISLTFRCLVDG